MRILLVEDHGDTAKVLERLLRKMGHEVIAVGSVAEALHVAEQEFQERKIDFVISDLGLPDGSGLDIMRQLSATHHVHGISLSGFGMDSDILESKAAGFSRHLVKPINTALLRRAINELLAEV